MIGAAIGLVMGMPILAVLIVGIGIAVYVAATEGRLGDFACDIAVRVEDFARRLKDDKTFSHQVEENFRKMESEYYLDSFAF
jgi:hypothetical protein